jgi:hypothetical protein
MGNLFPPTMETFKKPSKNFPKIPNIINENCKLTPKKLKENENKIKLCDKKKPINMIYNVLALF